MIDPKSGYSFDPEDALASWVAAHGSAVSPIYPFKGLGSSGTAGKAAKYDAAERSYMHAYSEYFLQMWGQLRTPMYARVDAALTYRKCARMGLTKGRPTSVIVAAICFITWPAASSAHGIAMWLYDRDIDIERVTGCFTLITRELNLKSYPFRIETRRLMRVGVRLLGLSSMVTDRAVTILDTMLKDKTIGRRKERALAAMIVYRAARELGVKIGQKQVADTFRVSERGLRRFEKERI